MKKVKGKNISTIEKPKDFSGTLKQLFGYLKEYKVWIIFIALFAIFSTIFSIVGPKILGNATTEIFNGLVNKLTGGLGINFDAIFKILLFLVIIYLISSIFSYLQNILMASMSQKFTYKLRKEVSEKLNRLPMKYFDKHATGDVLSTITNDIDTLNEGLIQSVPQLVTTVVMLVGIIIMMLSINVSMAIIAVFIVPISAVIMLFIVRRSQKHFDNQQHSLAKVNGDIEEMFSGHSVIKLFTAEEKMLEKLEKDNEDLKESAWKSNFLSGLMHPIMVFIGNIGYVIIAIIGGIYCIKGKITIGNIQSFISYTKNLTNPIGQLAQVSSMLQSSVAAAERVFLLLNEEEEKVNNTEKVEISKIKGKVEFKHVNFGYDEGKTIINDLNAVAKPGEKIAIVGPTGAGKTTIVKLLMHFYNVNSGEILIDGKNIDHYEQKDLRTIFGMVLQDTWMFNGTIMENLKFGKLDATDDDVIEAAKAAHVHHFIKTLPDAYDMEINEETSNISQGQKQLLTIARAILADPKILILDEATSSVDTRTEILIQKAMDKLMEGRTSFIIAHRLSTIQNADLILVMDKGDIIEIGNHDELMKKGGFYSKLYNSQFE
ncbi:MAG: ABC transporter ATP-binding protein [Bacilli bacterium]